MCWVVAVMVEERGRAVFVHVCKQVCKLVWAWPWMVGAGGWVGEGFCCVVLVECCQAFWRSAAVYLCHLQPEASRF